MDMTKIHAPVSPPSDDYLFHLSQVGTDLVQVWVAALSLINLIFDLSTPSQLNKKKSA